MPGVPAPSVDARGAIPDELPVSVTHPVGRVDDHLRCFVESSGLPANLVEAVLYSLLGPGKRARPLLAWHACAATGSPGEVALPAAAAIELIHAFSLVHDDLPGMDNDDLRRGRPTLHRHTSEAMAILAGDAMLTLAFRVINDQVADAPRAILLSHELASSTAAMIAGQVYDTLGGFPRGGGQGAALGDAERLQLVHSNKTGALIRAACRMGAQSSPTASEPVIASLTAYGEAIGLMFQIVDDLLDVTQTTAHLGKRSGKDQDAGKLTYPGVLGIERSRSEVRRLHDEANAALASLGAAAEPLRQLCTYLAVRSR